MSSKVTPLSSKNSSALNDGTSGDLTLLEQVQKGKDDKETLQWCMTQYNKCKNQRSAKERQWYVNLAFYSGKQNIQLTTSKATTNGFQITTPKAPPWRVRMVINKMRPAVRKQVANLTSQEPKFFTVPGGTTDADNMSARIAESIIDNYYREAHYKIKLKQLIWWGSICGSSFFKTYWDKTVKDANGNQGDYTTDVITPFHIYVPDLLQSDLELQPYVIHASTMSPDKVKQLYGIDCKPNVSAASSLLDDQFLNLTGINRSKALNECLVLEFWVKPGAYNRFPAGGLITIAGETLVQQSTTGWPYKHGEYPFAKFDDIFSGQFYAEALLTDLLPLQREFNRSRSQIIEAKNLMAKPKLVAPKGSVNASQITSEPGQVIYFTPGLGEPHALIMPQLPAYVENEIARIDQDFSDIAGQHDISKLIGSRTSATSIAAVQEQDSTMISGAATSVEQLTEKTARQILSLTKQYFTTERTIKIVGEDQAFETLSFINTDITDNTEIYVETGSALPYNKAGRQALLMDVYKLGLIPDANDVLELMDIGGFDKIQADLLTDQRQAQRENLQMVALGKNPPVANFDQSDEDPLQTLIEMVQEAANPNPLDLSAMPGTSPISGQSPTIPGAPNMGPPPAAPNALGTPTQAPPSTPGQQLPPGSPPVGVAPVPTNPQIPDFPVNEWDNHDIHIMIHNRFRKSQQFAALDDMTKQIFQQHVALHNQAKAQNIQGLPQAPQTTPVGGPAIPQFPGAPGPLQGQPLPSPSATTDVGNYLQE